MKRGPGRSAGCGQQAGRGAWYSGAMTEEGSTGADIRPEHFQLLVALARAHVDRLRPDVRTDGLDERDLAFEAGLIQPMETELTIYATQKRGRIVRLLTEMKAFGWVEVEARPPVGSYHVMLQSEGMVAVREHLRPWWSKLLDRWLGRR